MKVEDFFSTYNARHLKPTEVAESFIWSENFEKLIQNSHTVILGARGCGKTTLMKMLTLPALYSWKHERASDIRTKLPFYGVYISTDIYWDVKNQTYSSQLSQFGNLSETISIFSVSTNVFTSLCETFQNIIKYEKVTYEESKEAELCKKLITAWKLPNVIPRLKFIKEALNDRVDEVNQFIQNLILTDSRDNIPHFDYFNLSFESSLESVIPIFERIFDIEKKKNWALCFDELEFAPIWLQEKLFKSLRSRKQYILYKLSSSPILPEDLKVALKHVYSPTSGNDLVTLKMWGNADSERFSRKIIDYLLKKKFKIEDAESFFGSNSIYAKDVESYTNGSEFHKKMISLYRKDDSFKSFIDQKKININQPSWGEKDLMDTLFRKIKPIVYYRDFYISKNIIGKKTIFNLRSRKSAEPLFSGIEVLTKICDGNPRWLIGLINAILSRANTNCAEPRIQFDEIFKTSLRFKNVMNNIPIGTDNNISLSEIVERIGTYFNKQVLGSDFQMDPRGTIEINPKKTDVPRNVTNLIKMGIAQGAFILLDGNNDSFDYDIHGKKLKLSFLFFPIFKLPLRNYPDAKLTECLNPDNIIQSGQISLF